MMSGQQSGVKTGDTSAVRTVVTRQTTP